MRGGAIFVTFADVRNADKIDVYYWAEIFREDKEGKSSIAGYARFFLTQDSWKRSTKNVELFWPRSLDLAYT